MNHLYSSIIIFCEKGEISAQNPVHFENGKNRGVETYGTSAKVQRDHQFSWRLSSDSTKENFIKLSELANPWRSSHPTLTVEDINAETNRREWWTQWHPVNWHHYFRTVALTLYPTETFKVSQTCRPHHFGENYNKDVSQFMFLHGELEIPFKLYSCWQNSVFAIV